MLGLEAHTTQPLELHLAYSCCGVLTLQAELVAAMNSLAARQEQLVDAITQLSTHVSSLSSQQQEQQQQEQHKHLPQPGVSTIPWI
jgi:uncharacterized protein (DUF3084 family)